MCVCFDEVAQKKQAIESFEYSENREKNAQQEMDEWKKHYEHVVEFGKQQVQLEHSKVFEKHAEVMAIKAEREKKAEQDKAEQKSSNEMDES